MPFVISLETCSSDDDDCMSLDRLNKLADGNWEGLESPRHLASRISEVISIRPNESYESRWRWYIYCPPCIRFIDLALAICGSLSGFNGVVRVDDRLQTPCSIRWNPSARLHKLETLVEEIEKDWRAGKNYDWGWLSSHIDISWLQQRLHEIDYCDPHGLTSMEPLFDQAEDDQRSSAIIVLATPVQCLTMLTSPPVSKPPKAVSHDGIYRLKNRGEATWAATFFRKHGVVYAPSNGRPLAVHVRDNHLTTENDLGTSLTGTNSSKNQSSS